MPNLQLSKNLLTLRKANHFTQDQVSDYLNISRQAYSNYETSNRMPDVDTLIRLARLYHITLDELVTHNYSNGIAEQIDFYNLGINISNGGTLYLTEQEVQLIQNYRTLNDGNRKILNGFLETHSNTDKKSNN